jgi:hypothetical protein
MGCQTALNIDPYQRPTLTPLGKKHASPLKTKKAMDNGILNKKYQITVPDEIKSISLTDIL